jgi:hypothetical protein
MADPSLEDVVRLSALKMIDFYETLGNGVDSVNFRTKHAREVTGIDIPAVEKDMLVSWLSDWAL